MDVLRLDPTTYLPDALIEDYSSMIWTERYSGAGEFKMKSSQVLGTLDFLQEGRLITLLDTKEVMIIETRSVGVDNNGYPEVTVTGRTFETFLEQRAITALTYNEPWKALKQYKDSEMASLLLWNTLVNSTGQDPTRSGTIQSTLTAIANLGVTISSNLTETASDWWLESGEVYEFFTNVLSIEALGIRSIRPSGFSASLISFDTTNTSSRGAIIKTPTSGITKLCLDVYSGLDRTDSQTIREPIIFHYTSGDIDEPSYLRSIRDYKNMAIVTSSIGVLEVQGIPPAGSGMNRRILYLDGGDIGDLEYAVFSEALKQKAKAELQQHNMLYMFDGAISPLARYKYGVDYNLGDTVTVMAGYNVHQTMMVSEYIRTEDAEGDRGYPGLSAGAEVISTRE